MPNAVTIVAGEARRVLRTLDPRPPAPFRSTARWSAERAHHWAERTPWLVGCNFTPSTAGNQLELWQESTFDEATIDRELGWAADLGMNSVRVFLHDLAWQVDPTGFLDRLDRVLALANTHGVSLMPVLFDGIWDPDPRVGPQREPRPGVHNSTWLQSPGGVVIGDPGRWEALRPYVDSVIGRYGADERVVMWDLFNEPDSPNPAYMGRDPRRKGAKVARLLDRVFDWATTADPDQPLTAGVFACTTRTAHLASPAAEVSLRRSDIVTFHSYQSRKGLEATIAHLAGYGRPLVCTEWMGRPHSPVDLLEVFARRDVGAYCWGLVDGRTQTRFPWTSWIRRGRPGDPWFHELLHADGSPYDRAEAALFRSVTAAKLSSQRS